MEWSPLEFCLIPLNILRSAGLSCGFKVQFFFGALAITSVFGQPLKVKVKSPYAVLMDANSGKVLYSKRGDAQTYPASTTKIATLLYVVELLDGKFDDECLATSDLLKKVTGKQKIESDYAFPAYYLQPDGTSFNICSNEKLPIEALLYGIILTSGNDASNVVANHLGGTIPHFMDAFNAYLKHIGCRQTHFANPHGLHYPTHKTTACELAKITREALKHPIIRKILNTVEFQRPKTNKQPPIDIINSNRLLKPGKFYYPHAIGGKTGYTDAAGNCLVAIANNGDRELIAVIFKAPEGRQNYRDAITLFDAGFSEKLQSRPLYKQKETNFVREVGHSNQRLKATIKEDVFLSYYPSEEPKIETQLVFNELVAPIKKGERVGEILVKNEWGKLIINVPIFSKVNVKETLFFKLLRFFTILKLIWLLLLVLGVIGGALLIRRSRACQISQED
ncbi:MAG: D-alanyl-D-alanine carboxypeptidase [Simkaniaceae bacterium]|nr:D-alanyl-D-alanine carboxypeptidase [Simkaniaceae bacterium]